MKSSHIFPLLAAFAVPSSFADVFTWTDNGGNNNWIGSSNWSQSGGSGDYPGEKRDTDEVFLDGTFSNNTAKFDIDLTTSSSANVFTIEDLDVRTDNSADDWVVQIGAQSTATLKVRNSIALNVVSSGSFTFNPDLELATNNVLLGASGQGGTFNGQLIGGSARLLNANATVNVAGVNLAGGTITFAATDNDGFTGTIKTGRSNVAITGVNGLRNATVELASTNWGNDTFIHPDDALIGTLTGIGPHALVNSLKVGNSNTNSTYSGVLSGNSDLRKVGTGVWTLSNANTHSGTTFIDAGQIKLGNALALQNSKVFFNINNPINLNGHNPTFGGLDGVGALNLGTSTTTIAGNASASALGNLSGTGTLIIDRSALQAIGSNATFSGDIQLISGTLNLFGGSIWNSGSIFFDGGRLKASSTATSQRGIGFFNASSLGEIEVDGGDTLTWAGSVGGGSTGLTLRKLGGGTLALTNNSNPFDGTLELDAGSLSVTATALQHAELDLATDNAVTFADTSSSIGSLTGTANLNLGSGNSVAIGGNDRSSSYSGDFSGSAGSTLTKEGTGVFTYAGTSGLTQPVELDGGTLELDAPDTSTSMLNGINSDAGTTVAGQGRLSSGMTLDGDIAPGEPGAGNYGTLRAGGIILTGTYHCEVSAVAVDKVLTDGILDLAGATLDVTYPGGFFASPAVIIARYGFLNGTFASVSGIPAGYRVDYAYHDGTDADNIAIVEDNTAPTLVSITPAAGTADPTNAGSIDFDIAFSENVLGVDAGDFTVTFPGTTGSASISGSGESYTLTIPGVGGDGLLSVSLGAGQNITDEAGNGLTPSALSGATTIDNTAPTRVSGTTTAPNPTNAGSIDFTYVFSEPVAGFDDPDDTEIVIVSGSPTGAVTQIVDSGDATSFTVTLGNLTGDGSLRFRVKGANVTDLAGNQLGGPTAADTHEIDNTAPSLDTIALDAVVSDPTNAGSIDFDITFSEDVENVDASDFTVSYPHATGTPTLSGSGSAYTLTVPGVTDNGTLGVSLGAGHGITDPAGNGLSASAASASVVIDNTAPSVSSILLAAGISDPTMAGQIEFDIVFSEDVENVDAADFSISFPGSTGTASVSGSGDTYTLTVPSVTGDGTLGISLNAINGISDPAGNALASSAISESVVIDQTAPNLVSITLGLRDQRSDEFRFPGLRHHLR